jgi:hypothetical protein
VLTAVVVITGIFGRQPSVRGDDGQTTAGDCVLGNVLVSCEDPHEFLIVGFPGPDGTCPDGQAVRKLSRNVCTVDDN